MAHRFILCAAMAQGKSTINNFTSSDDIDATIDAIKSMGATVHINHKAKSAHIDSSSILHNTSIHTIQCNESASTLRFLIPTISAYGMSVTLRCAPSLAKRPLDVYMNHLPKFGVNLSKITSSLYISGQLKPGNFTIPGNISSQFISGLLMALPILQGDSRIILTSPLQTSPYVNLTLSTLRHFRVNIETDTRLQHFTIKGQQNYIPCTSTLENDWSAASVFIGAGIIGDTITLNNLNLNSHQGDKHCIEILKRFGGNITTMHNKVIASPGSLHGAGEIDAAQTPDIVPILAVVATLATGTTRICNISGLKVKESNRLVTIAKGLNSMGGKVLIDDNCLVIQGVDHLKGKVVQSYNDHRIAMALSIASIRANGYVNIVNPWCVRKSYPHFFTDYEKLGGKINVINLGK